VKKPDGWSPDFLSEPVTQRAALRTFARRHWLAGRDTLLDVHNRLNKAVEAKDRQTILALAGLAAEFHSCYGSE